MADTYVEWLAGVYRTIKDLRARGVTSRRVDVDVKELAAWCKERGKALDGAARLEYAAGESSRLRLRVKAAEGRRTPGRFSVV